MSTKNKRDYKKVRKNLGCNLIWTIWFWTLNLNRRWQIEVTKINPLETLLKIKIKQNMVITYIKINSETFIFYKDKVSLFLKCEI